MAVSLSTTPGFADSMVDNTSFSPEGWRYTGTGSNFSSWNTLSGAYDFPSTESYGNWTFSNDSIDPSLKKGSFGYNDVSERARRFLTQPVMLIAIVFGVIVIIANILSLIVLSKVRSPLSSQFILITSLASSDILVGISVLFHIINKVLNPSYLPGYGPWEARLRSTCGYMIIKALNTTAINITLLNLMGMAIDHYVAIIKPLMHNCYMSRSRCTTMIIIFWIIAVLCGFSDFFSVLGELKDYHKYKKKFNFCEFIWLTDYHEEYTLFAIALLCLFTMLFIYVRIYWEVRHRTNSWPPQQELQKSKKALITTLLILGTFILCVMPNCIFQITMIIAVQYNPDAIQTNMEVLKKTDQYLYDLILLNSLCDPLIYAFRIREVRVGYVKLLRCCLQRFVKRKWTDQNSHNSVFSSGTYDENRKLSRTLVPFERNAPVPNNGVRSHLLWHWQKETNV